MKRIPLTSYKLDRDKALIISPKAKKKNNKQQKNNS